MCVCGQSIREVAIENPLFFPATSYMSTMFIKIEFMFSLDEQPIMLLAHN